MQNGREDKWSRPQFTRDRQTGIIKTKMKYEHGTMWLKYVQLKQHSVRYPLWLIFPALAQNLSYHSQRGSSIDDNVWQVFYNSRFIGMTKGLLKIAWIHAMKIKQSTFYRALNYFLVLFSIQENDIQIINPNFFLIKIC